MWHWNWLKSFSYERQTESVDRLKLTELTPILTPQCQAAAFPLHTSGGGSHDGLLTLSLAAAHCRIKWLPPLITDLITQYSYRGNAIYLWIGAHAKILETIRDYIRSRDATAPTTTPLKHRINNSQITSCHPLIRKKKDVVSIVALFASRRRP